MAEGRKAGGIRQAARELGVPHDQVARAVKIASLSPDAKAVPGGKSPGPRCPKPRQLSVAQRVYGVGIG